MFFNKSHVLELEKFWFHTTWALFGAKNFPFGRLFLQIDPKFGMFVIIVIFMVQSCNMLVFIPETAYFVYFNEFLVLSWGQKGFEMARNDTSTLQFWSMQ